MLGTVLEAIPDGGCCGWENESNDQALLRLHGKTLTIFDERGRVQNPNYDVSFYSQNGKLSLDLGLVALSSWPPPSQTSRFNLPMRDRPIRRNCSASAKLCSICRRSMVKVSKIPRGGSCFCRMRRLVGWVSEKEMLIVEGRLLVAYNVASGARGSRTFRWRMRATCFCW